MCIATLSHCQDHDTHDMCKCGCLVRVHKHKIDLHYDALYIDEYIYNFKAMAATLTAATRQQQGKQHHCNQAPRTHQLRLTTTGQQHRNQHDDTDTTAIRTTASNNYDSHADSTKPDHNIGNKQVETCEPQPHTSAATITTRTHHCTTSCEHCCFRHDCAVAWQPNQLHTQVCIQLPQAAEKESSCCIAGMCLVDCHAADHHKQVGN